MKMPPNARQLFIKLFSVLLITLSGVALLVLIPLMTHRRPVPIEPALPQPSQTTVPSETSVPPSAVPTAAPVTPHADEALSSLLEDFAASHQGQWDLCVVNMSYGETVSYSQTDKPMVSASLIKLYIMGALFEQFQDGTLSYNNNRYLLREMITRSDSNAANRLIKALGGDDVEAGMSAVNAFTQSIGCLDTSLNRLMLEDTEHENYTSAKDCALFFKLLYRFELVSPEASAEMLELLKEQKVNDRIPAGLPENTICAHKTGELSSLCWADVGLVFSPHADYILCAICNSPPEDAAAVEDIASLSQLVYEHFNPPAEAPVDSEEVA